MRGETSVESERETRLAFADKIRDAGEQGLQDGLQLFNVTTLLEDQQELAAALIDPARSPMAKKRFVTSLFQGTGASKLAIDLLVSLSARQWSSVEDLADATEELGVDCILAASDAAHATDETSAQLAGINSAILNHPIVRQRLSDARADSQTRVAFWRDLFAGERFNEYARALAEHAAADLRGRKYSDAIEWLIGRISEHQGKDVVTVTSAIPLTQRQQDRIAALYAAKLRRQVHLNMIVDPSVIGGLRVQCGADVTDTTVVAQLQTLRKALA